MSSSVAGKSAQLLRASSQTVKNQRSFTQAKTPLTTIRNMYQYNSSNSNSNGSQKTGNNSSNGGSGGTKQWGAVTINSMYRYQKKTK